MCELKDRSSPATELCLFATVCVCEVKSVTWHWVTVFVCIQFAYVHMCLFDVPAHYEEGWVSSPTAAGTTSVAPRPLWADRRDCCMTSHWCLVDLRGHYLRSPSLTPCVCMQESEFERRVGEGVFEKNRSVPQLLVYLKHVSQTSLIILVINYSPGYSND